MIRDYAELIAEVSQRTGVAGIASRADMYVGMAEDYMRRTLRIGATDLLPDFDSLVSADTNWLLEASPAAYLQATMYQIYEASGDAEKGATFKALLEDTLNRVEYDAKLRATKGATIQFPAVLS